MSDETKRELVRSGERSELLAPGSTDAPTLSAQQIMALLRESLAKRARRSNSEIQAELTSLRRLAAHGNIDAQKNLGFLYYCGQDVPQDYVQAAHWYRRAADQGDYLAQFQLGEMYRQGQGVPQDYAQAVDWLRKSAEQDFDEAALVSCGNVFPRPGRAAGPWRSRSVVPHRLTSGLLNQQHSPPSVERHIPR